MNPTINSLEVGSMVKRLAQATLEAQTNNFVRVYF